jgi:teichuronic acid biosynthesis glycosyltransferase TuaH
MTDQQLAEHLSRHAPVLYVDPPISPLVQRLRGRGAAPAPRLRVIHPRLAVLTPTALPARTRPVIRSTTPAALRWAVRRAVAELGGTVAAVVVAHLDPVLTMLPGARRVLFASDDFVAGAELMRIPVQRLRRQEERALAEADRIITVSEALAETWRSRGLTVDVVPNGCDAERFARAATEPRPADLRLAGPVAVLAGHLSERIDVAVLEAVADRGVGLLLVGPRQAGFGGERVDRLFARPNVQWVGARPHDALPAYLGAARVGLVPYADTRFNRHSFPLKALEYLAAGLPVVGTDLPALRQLADDTGADVTVAADPAAFADIVESLAADVAQPSSAAARRAFAAQHDWTHRAQRFAELIGVAALDAAPTASVPSSVDIPGGAGQ